MDLSFTLKPRGEGQSRNWIVSLADIRAAADTHRKDQMRVTVSAVPGKESATPDTVHALACNIVPEREGGTDNITLCGSFNPLVARQLMVGKIG